jgi:hypothetical protein
VRWAALAALLLVSCVGAGGVTLEPNAEPTDGTLALHATGSLPIQDTLRLSETNGYQLPGDDPAGVGFMSLEWDGSMSGVVLEGAPTVGAHDDYLVSILTSTAQRTFDFTTEVARNQGRCVVTITRVGIGGIEGRFVCHLLRASLIDAAGTLVDAPGLLDADATFEAVSGAEG